MAGLAIITEACIDVKDRACVDVCPVQCIYEFDPARNQLFSEDDPGSGVIETHTYAVRGVYTVTLNVTDNTSLSSIATHQIVVDISPRAAFLFAPAAIYIGVAVTFNGSTSTDSDGTIVTYNWTFGDGANVTGPVVTHAYGSKGTFIASLVVVDDAGLLCGALNTNDLMRAKVI